MVVGAMSNPIFIDVQTDNFRNQVAKVLEECYPFANYSFDRADKDHADFIVHYKVLHTYNNFTSVLAMTVTFTTLGIIPTAVKDNYDLQITVTNRDGREIHKKQYEDYTRTWLHLIFLPFGGTLEYKTNIVLSNMVRASLLHLQFNEALLAAQVP